MKVLVTGIAGFIGFHAAKALHKSGMDVVGVDNFNTYYDSGLKRARVRALPDSVNVVELDIADNEALRTLFEKEQPDVVLHLAAQAGVRYSLEQPFAYAQSNLVGHLSVLEVCRHAKNLSHLVYASSSSVYGESDKAPFSEDQPVTAPVSLYAATKRSDELMSDSYAHLYGLKQIGLRFFTVYGQFGRPDMAYWIFTEKIINDQPIKLFNEGKMRRDMTHVSDVVDGVLSIVNQTPTFSADERSHRIYNIGNNRPEALETLVSTIETAIGKPAQRILEPMQPGDVTQTCADISRITADYGYTPSTPISEGVPDFVDWYRSYFNV